MAVSPTPPPITLLPAPALPTDPEAVFDTKAGVSLTAQAAMVPEVNTALTWVAGALVDTKGYKDAAATSAGNAAESAELAQEQVGLVTEQVEAAVEAREGAEAAEAQALVYLQATEAGAGIPPAVPDKFLGTDAEGNPLWKSITIPPAFAVGDLLDSSRTLTAPNWLACDGAAYLQASYPALFAEIGPATSPFEPAVVVTTPTVQPNGQCIAFSSTGNYLAYGQGSTNFSLYKKTGDTFTSVAVPDPAYPALSVSWSPDDTYLALALASQPLIYIYKRSGDTFTKLANPATLPAAAATGCAFSPDGNYLAVSHNNTPFMTVYKRAGDVFTKLVNPATLPPGNKTTCVAWSPDSTYVVFGNDVSPYMTIYKRSGDVFTKLADPASLPTNAIVSAAWSPDGNYLALGGPNAPFLTIYKRSGDTFTKLANPATLPSATVSSLVFSPDGNFLAIAQSGVAAWLYRQAGDVFTKMTTSIGTPTGISFSPDSRYVAISAASPGITVVKEATYITKTEFLTPTLTQPGTFATIKRYIKA